MSLSPAQQAQLNATVTKLLASFGQAPAAVQPKAPARKVVAEHTAANVAAPQYPKIAKGVAEYTSRSGKTAIYRFYGVFTAKNGANAGKRFAELGNIGGNPFKDKATGEEKLTFVVSADKLNWIK